MRIAVLLVAVGTVVVCWMAISFVFGGRYYYFTESSIDERMNGVVERLNAEPRYQSDDGSINLGYFLLGQRIEHRVVMPEDWDGEFGTVDLPAEASDLPSDFLELVQLVACDRREILSNYVDGDVSYEAVFLNFAGQPAAKIRANSKTC